MHFAALKRLFAVVRVAFNMAKVLGIHQMVISTYLLDKNINVYDRPLRVGIRTQDINDNAPLFLVRNI